MASIYDIINMIQKLPQSGGLSASNYPNPYGLRSFPLDSNSYGGEMMPKTSGWQGLIPSLLDSNQKITEFYLGGEGGEPFYPMVTENMTPEMIQNIRLLEAGKLDKNSQQVKQLENNAYQQYLIRKSMGLSPFKDYN
jgi:hypothetical protein